MQGQLDSACSETVFPYKRSTKLSQGEGCLGYPRPYNWSLLEMYTHVTYSVNCNETDSWSVVIDKRETRKMPCFRHNKLSSNKFVKGSIHSACGLDYSRTDREKNTCSSAERYVYTFSRLLTVCCTC